MKKNTNWFENYLGGFIYDCMAGISGFGSSYYRRIAQTVPLQDNMKVLDIGCGTGSLSFAIAKQLNNKCTITGIDISNRQLQHAQKKQENIKALITFRYGSAEQLDFPDDSFNLVCISQVMHALPSITRNDCLREIQRVLQDDGKFILAEWSRPKIGYTGLLWLPSLLGHRHTPNWQGTYPQLIGSYGFTLTDEIILDSLNTCMIFTPLKP